MSQKNNAKQADQNPEPVKADEGFAKKLGNILEPVGKLVGLLSGVGAVLSAIVSIGILMTYAKAIGRVDLLPLVLDKKFTALFPWMGLTALFWICYALIMFFTTMTYTFSVWIYNDTPATRPRVATLLMLSAIVGSVIFVVLTYKFADMPLWYKACWIFGSMFVCMMVSLLDLHFRLAIQFISLFTAPKQNAVLWHRVMVFLFTAMALAGAVFCAVYPMTLLLRSYVGEDTPEAVNHMMVLSMVAVSVVFLPAWLFFISKEELVVRSAKAFGLAFGIALTLVVISPGASSTIVYSAAGALGVRDATPVKYRLKKNFESKDFDNETWGDIASDRKLPVVTAFPLFSLGDILLLCPASLANLTLKDWSGGKSLACILTQSSDVVRLPAKLKAVTESAAQSKPG